MKLHLLLLLFVIEVSCNSENTGHPTNPPVEEKKTPAAEKNAPASVELKVVILPTSDASQEDSFVSDFKYPPTITVNDAYNMGDSIAAYGTAYKIWVGPKGWAGKSEEGADGTTAVHLYPVGDSLENGPHIFIYEVPACIGCMLSSAAVYFPQAMKDYNENYNQDHSLPIGTPKDIHINKMSPTLVTYSFPVRNGLLTTGVAYYSTANDPYYIEAKYVLPAWQSKLAEFLCNTL